MSDTVISVEHLSKRYQLGVINTGTFTNDLKVLFGRCAEVKIGASGYRLLMAKATLSDPAGTTRAS